MQPFYQAKASKSYHQKHEGELFIHNVEVVMNARMMATQYNLPKRTQDCVFVGGLLHDIGKVLMHYNTGNDNKKVLTASINPSALWCWLSIWRSSSSRTKGLFEAMSTMLSAQVASRKY